MGISEYSSNGWKFGQSNKYTHLECDYTLTKPFEIGYEITEMNSSYTIAIFISTNNLVNYSYNNIELRGTSNITVYTGSIIGKYNLKVYSSYMELFKDGIKLGQADLKSDSIFVVGLESGTQSGRWIRLKDFTINEL